MGWRGILGCMEKVVVPSHAGQSWLPAALQTYYPSSFARPSVSVLPPDVFVPPLGGAPVSPGVVAHPGDVVAPR